MFYEFQFCSYFFIHELNVFDRLIDVSMRNCWKINIFLCWVKPRNWTFSNKRELMKLSKRFIARERYWFCIFLPFSCFLGVFLFIVWNWYYNLELELANKITFSIIILILIFSMSLYIVSYCYSLKLAKVYSTIRFFESFREFLVQFCLIIFHFVNSWLKFLCV